MSVVDEFVYELRHYSKEMWEILTPFLILIVVIWFLYVISPVVRGWFINHGQRSRKNTVKVRFGGQ